MADTLDSLLVPPLSEKGPYFVYFITGRKVRYPIKIGISGKTALRGRLKSIQTAMPYDLVLLYVCPCDVFQFEREIHATFERHRLRGEWFKRNELMMKFIRDCVTDFPDWREQIGFGDDEWR